jgi:hypothetical protein
MQWIFWLLAIIISSGAGYWVYRADRKRAVPYPWVTSLLRSLVVFFTLLLVLVPTIVITNHVTEKPIVLLLQDNSRSVGNALGTDSISYRKSFETLAAKLSDKYKVVQWGFGGSVQTDSAFVYRQPATDISSALSRAQEFYGIQNLGAIVLATDGRFNQGVNPLYQQLSLHCPLYTVAIGDSARQKDLRIARAYANRSVTVNSSFELRADVVAELCRGYNNGVSVKEGNETLATVPLAVNTDKYDRSVSFTINFRRSAGREKEDSVTIRCPSPRCQCYPRGAERRRKLPGHQCYCRWFHGPAYALQCYHCAWSSFITQQAWPAVAQCPQACLVYPFFPVRYCRNQRFRAPHPHYNGTGWYA